MKLANRPTGIEDCYLTGMTRYKFHLLSPRAQLLLVLMEGTYLAQRWDEEVGSVSLYYLCDEGRGFFVEIAIDDAQDRFAVLRSFRSSGPLDEYAQRVRLPGE
jgi:hypothetical protein